MLCSILLLVFLFVCDNYFFIVFTLIEFKVLHVNPFFYACIHIGTKKGSNKYSDAFVEMSRCEFLEKIKTKEIHGNIKRVYVRNNKKHVCCAQSRLQLGQLLVTSWPQLANSCD